MEEEEEAKVKAVSTRKKNELEADMNLLTKANYVAVAEAELQAYSERANSRSEISVPYVNRRERTEQYVFSQVRRNELHPEAEEFNHEQFPKQLIFDPKQVTVSEPLNQLPAANSQRFDSAELHGNSANQMDHSDFTRFLLRKDLLLQRLTVYDDKPENFFLWKGRFRSVVTDLCVTPSEEFDLLLKWLGPDSKKHAMSLMTSNAANPVKCLERLWERLNERYGAP